MYTTTGSQTDNMRLVISAGRSAVVSLPQLAADTTFKIPSVYGAQTQGYGIAHPPGPQDNAQGLTQVGGSPTGAGVLPTCTMALKRDSWNNFVMSTITAGAYTGVAYGIDAFTAPTTKAVVQAEKKVETAVKTLEKVEAAPSSSDKKVEVAEKKVEAAEKTLEKAMEKTSGKSLIKTSSKAGGLLTNGLSQLGISMGTRTAATCASASSQTFQKNIQYITPLASGSLRGIVDYFLLGRNVGRTITDSMVVAGLEYASTGVVMGFK